MFLLLVGYGEPRVGPFPPFLLRQHNSSSSLWFFVAVFSQLRPSPGRELAQCFSYLYVTASSYACSAFQPLSLADVPSEVFYLYSFRIFHSFCFLYCFFLIFFAGKIMHIHILVLFNLMWEEEVYNLCFFQQLIFQVYYEAHLYLSWDYLLSYKINCEIQFTYEETESRVYHDNPLYLRNTFLFAKQFYFYNFTCYMSFWLHFHSWSLLLPHWVNLKGKG